MVNNIKSVTWKKKSLNKKVGYNEETPHTKRKAPYIRRKKNNNKNNFYFL